MFDSIKMAVIASRPLFQIMEALLHQPVLVLNRLWQAVNICSARRALTLLFEGNAQVVHSEDGDFNTFGFHQWADLSEEKPDPESIPRREHQAAFAACDSADGLRSRASEGG